MDKRYNKNIVLSLLINQFYYNSSIVFSYFVLSGLFSGYETEFFECSLHKKQPVKLSYFCTLLTNTCFFFSKVLQRRGRILPGLALCITVWYIALCICSGAKMFLAPSNNWEKYFILTSSQKAGHAESGRSRSKYPWESESIPKQEAPAVKPVYTSCVCSCLLFCYDAYIRFEFFSSSSFLAHS
jgi:hypothetical protein